MSRPIAAPGWLLPSATRADRLPHEIATGLIETWMRFAVQENTVPVILRAAI